MKSFLPSLRRWNKGSSSEQQISKKTQSMEKLHKQSRSLDDSFDASERINSKGYLTSIKTARSYSDDVSPGVDVLSPPIAFYNNLSANVGYNSDSDGQASVDDYINGSLETSRSDSYVKLGERSATARQGILKQSSLQDPSPGSSPVQTEFSEMVDQDDIVTLTLHVRSFSVALNSLRNTFIPDETARSPNEVQGQAHQRLGEVLTILKDILGKYPPLNSTEIIGSAGTVIKKIKEHNYYTLEEPNGFFEATDQLALAFSSSVSDYLMGDQDASQNLGISQTEIQNSPSFDALQKAGAGYDEEEDKRIFSEGSGDFLESYVCRSERAESEESLEKMGYDEGKSFSLSNDCQANSTILGSESGKIFKTDSILERSDDLVKALLSMEGSVDISLQRSKVWSKYAKEIQSYMERRSHIEADYCKQLAKLAQTIKAGITEESYLPFQSTFATALENDYNYASNCQKRLQQDLRGRILEQLSGWRGMHDRSRSKLKEKWTKDCKKLNDSVNNLKKAKSMYVQKQQELERFVDKQEMKEELASSSSVVASFSIGKKKKEEEIAKRAEEAEEYYKKCVDEANIRQEEVEKTKKTVLLDLKDLVYQSDMTMQRVTTEYFQMLKSLSAALPIQYQTLAEGSKQYRIGSQFAEYVKLQQATSKVATQKHFSFEIYRADDKGESHKGYIGPADLLMASPPDADHADQKDSPSGRRRISTISAGSDTSLNRPTSPANGMKLRSAWGPPNRNSNSDDTGSVSSRSLPGSPSGSPTIHRKVKPQRLSLGQNDIDREILKKETPGPFRNVKLSEPATTHTFKKLRSSSKCKKCDSYVYFNGAECEHCGLTCHKKCLETLAIKCGKSRLPRKMTTFGVDFHKHLNATHRDDIPLIMEKCITEIDDRCLQIRGIYRVSGVKTKVEVLSQQFETGGHMVDLGATNPHLITSVLKLYLRELPEPLMTFDLYPEFVQIAKDSSGLKFYRKGDAEEEIDEENDSKCEECLRRLHNCIKKLPHANFYTVVRLFKHLRRVANNEIFNQMSINNLAIIFGPTLLRPRGSPSSLSALMDMTHQARVVELLILNSQILDEEFSAVKSIDERDEIAQLKAELSMPQEDTGKSDSKESLDKDPVVEGKEELSLSDELQLDFAEIFKRADSSGKELSSSLGSMDGVSDTQSPEIEEELKDLVHRTRLDAVFKRPPNLSLADSAKEDSQPDLLSAGSESNVSFGSLSPVDLPDTSLNNSLSDANRTSHNDEQSKTLPEATEMVLDGLKLEAVIVKEECETNDSDYVDGRSENREINEIRSEPSPRTHHETADVASKSLKSVCKSPLENDGAEKIILEDSLAANIVRLEESPFQEELGNFTDVTAMDTYETDADFCRDQRNSLGRTPPKIAPKPSSPARTLSDENIVSSNTNEAEISKSYDSGIDINRPDEQVVEKQPVFNVVGRQSSSDSDRSSESISGNTKKLREKFIAEVEKISPRENESDATSKQSSLERQTNERSRIQEVVRKGSNNTAKLVQKFSKEKETKTSRSSVENSPVPPKGVSVKRMLRQFESGDEMDDEDTNTTQNKPKISVRRSYADSKNECTVDSGCPETSDKEQRQVVEARTSETFDEKARSAVEQGVKREPKFV